MRYNQLNKLFLLLAINSILITKLHGQSPNLVWAKSFGGNGDEKAFSVDQTRDGGCISAGYTTSTDGDITTTYGDKDFWVVKNDSLGNMEWQRSLGGSGTDWARAVRQTLDGGYIVVGLTNSDDGDIIGNHGLDDLWVVKLDSAGNFLWQNTLGGSSYDYAQDVQLTSDGGYIVVGGTGSHNGDVSMNHGGLDYWVVKLNYLGAWEWERALGGSGNDLANAVKQTSDGGYIVVGNSASTDGNITNHHAMDDVWAVKLTNGGVIEWQLSLGGENLDRAFAVQQTSEGGYIIAGTSLSAGGDLTVNHGNFDSWLIKLTPAGVMLWQHSFGGTNQETAYGVMQTSDGGYIVGGSTQSNNGDVAFVRGPGDYWLLKTNSVGDLLWEKTFGGNGRDEGMAIDFTSEGGYIMAGFSNSTNGHITDHHGDYDFWLLKTGTDYTPVNTVNIDYLNIYPNPTEGIVNLALGTSTEYQDATLNVTNLLGERIITQMVNSTNPSVDLSNQAQGLYFLQLKTTSGLYIRTSIIKL